MAVRVLIVDDALFMRSMIRDIFSREGFEVVGEAENGAEAVRLHRDLKPDLTTMDIVMPVLDGLSALREVVRMDPRANVIMVSALGQESLIAEAIEAGARDFIVKPFQASRVLKVVQSALGLDERFRPRVPPAGGSPGSRR
ncbi:MAG: response regulator [candidate division NC10 bacterium]|nr:response regulator [candidate division NC10 bacterium]